jgi:hypothetical protein
MDKKYACYCGLYCENCAVKARVQPAAKVLYNEMKAAGFEQIVHFMPEGEEFWAFLKGMAEKGTCTSCREGSGNPGCTVRICAKEKGVEMCALCESYPCSHFDQFFKGYPILRQDNALLREKGWDAWAQIQDERRANEFTYAKAE